MKIAIITDTHVGARNDSITFNDYFIKFFDEVFFPYLENNKIEKIIHLGDVFDRRKYINFKILDTWNRKIFPRLSKYDTHIVLGNHDTYYKNTNHVNSVEQLLSHYNFNIYQSAETVTFDGLDILLLPWINEENYQDTMDKINSSSASICMGHLEILGFEVFSGQVNTEHGLDKNVFKKFDMTFSGHFHHKSEHDDIYYLGSPYPMTWADWGCKRGFHIFDTETRELEFIENKNEIFCKIVYDDTQEDYQSLMSQDLSSLNKMYVKVIVSKKTNPYWFESYLEKITEIGPTDLSVVESLVDDDNNTDEIDSTKDTLTLLTEYVDNLDIKEHKDKVIDLFRELYVEAVNTDTSIN
jgi:DNA repair exonuclease SbcCD nuclease subunit